MKNRVYPDSENGFWDLLGLFGFRFKIRFSRDKKTGKTDCETEMELVPNSKTELLENKIPVDSEYFGLE